MPRPPTAQMDVFLGELEKETALLHRRVQQLDLLLADVFLAMCQPDDLQGVGMATAKGGDLVARGV